MTLRSRARYLAKSAQHRLDTARAVVDMDAHYSRLTETLHRFDSVVNTATGLGTDDDKGQMTDVAVFRPLNTNALRNLRRSSAYAGIFVERLPAYALRRGWRVRDESDSVDIAKAVTAQLKVHARLNRLCQEARTYGGGILLVIYDDHDQKTMSKAPSSTAQIVNLVVPDEREINISQYVADIKNHDYLEPAHVSYTPSNGTAPSGEVHRSRWIYMGGVRLSAADRLSNPVKPGFDDSPLQRAWPAIRNKSTIDQVMPVMAAEMKQSVMTLEDLPDKQFSDPEESLNLRMRLVAKTKSLLNIILLMPGEKFESQVTSVTGVNELDDQARTSLSASFSMPQTQLYGEAPAGLNTDGASGRAFFDGEAEGYQANTIDPVLLELYGKLAKSGQILPKGEMLIFWPELAPLSGVEEATRRKTNAEADAIYVQTGVLAPEIVQSSRFKGTEYGDDIVISDDEIEDDTFLDGFDGA